MSLALSLEVSWSLKLQRRVYHRTLGRGQWGGGLAEYLASSLHSVNDRLLLPLPKYLDFVWFK